MGSFRRVRAGRLCYGGGGLLSGANRGDLRRSVPALASNRAAFLLGSAFCGSPVLRYGLSLWKVMALLRRPVRSCAGGFFVGPRYAARCDRVWGVRVSAERFP